jgi:L-fuculose-phosphate aldolase
MSTNPTPTYRRFKFIGKKLFVRGMNNSHSGNISIRKKGDIVITATGTMLDEIRAKDLVTVSITPNQKYDRRASMELLVHRAIYKAHGEVAAIVHSHAPYAVTMAAGNNKTIIPYDHEGRYFFPKIPILRAKQTIASPEVAEKIGLYVKASAGAVIVDKHGVFAWGKNLEESYHLLMVVESACRLNYLVENKKCYPKR